jgi:hypothetical protein
MELNEAIARIQALQTSGANYDLTTEDIIERLRDWATRCDFTVDEVEADRIELDFQSLPENLEEFCEEVYEFCPDTVDQGYGTIGEMIESAEEMDEDIDEDTEELVDGVDLDAEDYGLELMKRDLEKKMHLSLWWD